MNEGKVRDPITLTEKAVQQIKKLMENDNYFGVKVGLKKGGCAGMEYTMDTVTLADPNDLIIEKEGARIIIAPMAQMFLFGTEIDYTIDILESGFKFTNPNVTEECGCGESIKFEPIPVK